MTNFVTGQIPTADQWNAAFAQAFPAGGVSSYSATLLTGMTQAAWLGGLGLPTAIPGAPSGLATLDTAGLLNSAQIPPAILNALSVRGFWNANTNTPALASSIGTPGFFYVVTTAGATSLDGNNAWAPGDYVFFDGAVWRKINGSGNISIPATNITDSTAVGRALLTAASVASQRASLNIDQAQLVVDTNQTITAAMEAVAWTSLTAPRVGQLPLVSSLNPGQALSVYDESGNCSAVNTLTLSIAGSDTINGGASFVLDAPFAGAVLFRGSIAKWTALRFVRASQWITQHVSVRQTVLSGPMDATGLPTFLPASSASLSITSQNISGATPFVAASAAGAAANGQKDTTGVATSNLTWSGLTANATNYLGVIVGIDGTLSTFSTTIAPVYQQGGTPSIVSGAITFNIGAMTCYQGNGSVASQVNAVIVARAIAGASSVTSVVPYAYNGIYDGSLAQLPLVTTTITHNLGVVPGSCQIFFKNASAEFNYSVGDTIQVLGSASPIVATLTDMSLFLTSNVSGTYSTLDKVNGTGVVLTRANWSMRVRVTRGW